MSSNTLLNKNGFGLMMRYGFLHVPRRWWPIVQLRMEGKTQEEVGERFGVSKARVSQIWIRAVKKIVSARQDLGLPINGSIPR